MFTLDEVARTAGATPRQVHHWTKRGWLAHTERDQWKLAYSPSEAQIAAVMVELIDCGFTVDAAARYARIVVTDATNQVPLAHGHVLMFHTRERPDDVAA
jgi:DNA-binding transcriptional MerR regulator